MGCDHLALTVDAPYGWLVRVSVATERVTLENYDLAVYDDAGAYVAGSNSRWGYESVTFIHRPRDGDVVRYDVRTAPTAVLPGSTYWGTAELRAPGYPGGGRPPGRPGGACTRTSAVQDLVAAEITPDDGGVVNLEILVLLDGVDESTGRAIMRRAAEAYGPLGISVRPHFKRVFFFSETWPDLMNEARAAVGGSRPSNVDVVHLITEKGLGLAEGVAPCNGGIAHPDSAFSLSRTHPQEDVPLPLTGTRTYVDSSAEFVAHEVGHLLGGRHDLANCGEGRPERLVSNNELSPCTIMWFESTPPSLEFSSLNAKIVRYYASTYARP